MLFRSARGNLFGGAECLGNLFLLSVNANFPSSLEASLPSGAHLRVAESPWRIQTVACSLSQSLAMAPRQLAVLPARACLQLFWLPFVELELVEAGELVELIALALLCACWLGWLLLLCASSPFA